jgi:membrane associated rhomboid family serine protease
VLIGAAKIAPNAQVILFIFPMQMKTMVWVFIAMAVYAVVFSGVNGGGQAAHLGGALVGWILMNHENWLNFALRSHPRMRIGGTKVKYKDWSKDLNR